jgi:hypothetical protein
MQVFTTLYKVIDGEQAITTRLNGTFSSASAKKEICLLASATVSYTSRIEANLRQEQGNGSDI